MSERSERLELAVQLRELADHASEAELRSSLSRSYYSIYHAARELGEIGYKEKVDHPNIVEFLGKVDPQLKESVGAFKRLRSQADYDETLIKREFGGDLEGFRAEVLKQLDESRLVFRSILLEIEKFKELGGK